MKKVYKMFIPLLLIGTMLSGCIPNLPKQEAEEVLPLTTEATPNIPNSNELYQTLLPYLPNNSKGTMVSLNNRLDASSLELGLIELAQTTFSKNQYLFQEGQIITADESESWQRRYSAEKNTLGLNPETGSPFLVHILEHNFLTMDTQELGGIALGLSISPYVQDQEGKITVLPIEEQRKKLQDLGDTIVQRIRAKGVNIPILVAGFSMQSSSSLIPGVFFHYGIAPKDKEQVENWRPIDESYVLYPSRSSLTGSAKDLETQFLNYKDKVQNFFPQYVGVISLVRFLSGEPVEMTLTVNAEYSSKTEVIALTQYMAGLIEEYFPSTLHVNLYVKSMDREQAIYVRPVKGEPFLHIYE